LGLCKSSDLKTELDAFQQAVLESIPAAVRKLPPFDERTRRGFLVSRVYELVKDSWAEICKKPEVSKHLERNVSLEHSGPIGIGSESMLGMSLVKGMLDRQVMGLEALTLRPDRDFGQSLADVFLSDRVTVVTKAPLYGLLLSSDDPVTLEEGIQLVPQILPSDEYNFLTAHIPSLVPIHPSVVFEHRWHERKIVSDSGKWVISTRPLEEDPWFRRLVLVLRLVGLSNFGAPYVEEGLLPPGFPFGYRQFRFVLSSASRCLSSPDEISKCETSGLSQAWKTLGPAIPPEDNNQTRWLAIALYKMNSACERNRLEDMLLDLCVSLEAMLTREPQQVTYQFRQRGTFLLSLACTYLSEGQLRTIRKFLGDAYDMRSKLVHGEPPDSSGVEETNAKLFELARIFSLKSIALSHSFTKDEIIRKIDLGMASKEARRELEDPLESSALAPFWNAPYEKASRLFQNEPDRLAESESCEAT